MMNFILYLIILILAFPIGYWLAHLCRDELVKGREWFRKIIIGAFLFALIGFVFFDVAIGLTFMFILIVSGISYLKSKDKEFVK